MPTAVVDQLVKRYDDRTVVDGVSFEVAAGETYGLLGPNGAGKTTTISIVCGLLAADEGEVTVAGRRMNSDAAEAKRAIGYVPQDVALYPDLTARENLAFFGKLHGLRGGELGGRVDDVLEVVGLSDRGDDRVEEYSGGMKRRANIAAGLLHRPALLVLDEPTVGVDPQSRNAILDTVADLRGAGMAIIYTTHYMEEAERLCDRVGIIDRGRLIAEGTRPELLALVGQNTTIRVDTASPVDVDDVRRVVGVVSASGDGGSISVVVDRLDTTLAPVVEAIGTGISNVSIDEPDLESVFLKLTGRALRDE